MTKHAETLAAVNAALERLNTVDCSDADNGIGADVVGVIYHNINEAVELLLPVPIMLEDVVVSEALDA